MCFTCVFFVFSYSLFNYSPEKQTLIYKIDSENTVNTFEFYSNIGLLKTKITNYSYMTDQSTTIEFQEREVSHAPLYTVSLGFTKHYKKFNFGANLEGKDKFYFSDSHNQESQAYLIANSYFDYQLNSNTIISLWSKNIFSTWR